MRYSTYQMKITKWYVYSLLCFKFKGIKEFDANRIQCDPLEFFTWMYFSPKNDRVF